MFEFDVNLDEINYSFTPDFDITSLEGGGSYSIATAERLGVVKIGARLDITPDGTLSAQAVEALSNNDILAIIGG